MQPWRQLRTRRGRRSASSCCSIAGCSSGRCTKSRKLRGCRCRMRPPTRSVLKQRCALSCWCTFKEKQKYHDKVLLPLGLARARQQPMCTMVLACPGFVPLNAEESARATATCAGIQSIQKAFSMTNFVSSLTTCIVLPLMRRRGSSRPATPASKAAQKRGRKKATAAAAKAGDEWSSEPALAPSRSSHRAVRHSPIECRACRGRRGDSASGSSSSARSSNCCSASGRGTGHVASGECSSSADARQQPGGGASPAAAAPAPAPATAVAAAGAEAQGQQPQSPLDGAAAAAAAAARLGGVAAGGGADATCTLLRRAAPDWT